MCAKHCVHLFAQKHFLNAPCLTSSRRHILKPAKAFLHAQNSARLPSKREDFAQGLQPVNILRCTSPREDNIFHKRRDRHIHGDSLCPYLRSKGLYEHSTPHIFSRRHFSMRKILRASRQNAKIFLERRDRHIPGDSLCPYLGSKSFYEHFTPHIVSRRRCSMRKNLRASRQK